MASYEKMSDNTWSVRFRIIEEGKIVNKRLRGFKKKSLAESAYREFMAAYKKPDEEIKNQKNVYNMTFEEIFYKFKAYNLYEIKESSYMTKMHRIENHILPYFKGKTFAKITAQDIADWKMRINTGTYIKNKIPTNFSYAYKKSLYNAFTNLYGYAIKFYDAKENLPAKIGGFKKDSYIIKNKIHFWTPEEFSQFISAFTGNSFDVIKYKTLFSFLYYTGCRKGEMSALNWIDIDFKNKKVEINKTASRKTIDGTYKITTPKTGNSIRITDLPDNLIVLLTLYKERMKEDGLYNHDHFVFGNEKPIPEQNITNWFNRYIKISEVKKITVHDLRHSHVSLLIRVGGYDLSMLYAIADRIGDTPEQILKTYGHLFPEKKNELLDALNAHSPA